MREGVGVLWGVEGGKQWGVNNQVAEWSREYTDRSVAVWIYRTNNFEYKAATQGETY